MASFLSDNNDNKINIAVRELIQNSIDAIHVYRMLTMQDNLAVGKIKVCIEKEENNYFLVVSDNGIGMSQNLLTNELLDFGGSYWKTNKFYNDFKGLPSKGFESIGKYGIGFFSSFMLGKEITVTSWKYGESIDAMRTLDFYDGLLSNPTLRLPTEKEKNSIIDRGTTVRIKLKNNPYDDEGIIYDENFYDCTLKSLVQYYIPSVDVEINVIELDGSSSSILPNSIEKLNFLEIMEYIDIKDIDAIYKKIGFVKRTSRPSWIDFLKKYPMQLIEIIENGKILGKLSILPRKESIAFDFGRNEFAIILAKGIRVKSIEDFAGYISTNEVVSIKRDQAAKIISYESMKAWASEQLKQIEKLNLNEEYKDIINDLIITFNFFDENFVLAKYKKDNQYTDATISDFKEYAKLNDKLVLYNECELEKNRLDTCDGFINVAHGLNMREIIIDSDLEKANHTQKIIKTILQEEWQEFEQSVEHNMKFDLASTEPYKTIWTFTRKIKSKQE